MADPNKWLGLLRWSMKYQDGTAPSEAKEMSKEDRDFLDKVLKEGVIDENERVRQILRIMDGEHPSIVFAQEGEEVNVGEEESKVSEKDMALYKDALLDELLVRIDQIDNAMNMVKSKGLDTLIRVIQNYERASTRAMAAEVCSVVVQNNPFCQDAAVEAGLVEVLCELARDEDVNCQVKAMLAISCLVRQHKAAEARFLSDKCDGLRVLENFLQPERDIRLKRKSLFFLRYLIRNSIKTAQQVLNGGFYIPAVVEYVDEDDADLCESALQALSEFASHDVYFKTACLKAEYRLQQRLDERIAKIEKREGEEREFAEETLNLAKQLHAVLEVGGQSLLQPARALARDNNAQALRLMVSRGSSIHHTRRSSNPFMATSSGIVGINLNEPIAYEAPRLPQDNQQTRHASLNSLEEFMYHTTSQGLGDGVHNLERTKLSQRMDKQSIRRELSGKGIVKVKAIDVVAPQDYALAPEDVIPPPIDTRNISEARSEHPLYATSNREIGVEKSQVKVEIERVSRPNTFTNSFNGFRYRDFGLNTAITKSRICDQLEYS